LIKKKVIVSVTNDLVSDQRVHKVCLSLKKMNFDVLLVGRKYGHTDELHSRIYSTKRMRLIFKKGFLFYMEYQIRLFFFLLFHRSDILLSNDLDTLLPNYIVSKLGSRRLLYDSHEYFTGVPELQNRPLVRKIWKSIEKFIFPRLKKTYTVNQSIAELYAKEYNVHPQVIRNVPMYMEKPIANRKLLGLPEDQKILILQGAGINVDRGAEELIMAMQYLTGFLLLIIGSGDVIGELKKRVVEYGLNDKVQFIGRLSYSELMSYTVCADLGLSLDKPNSINYCLSLPNKLFDYIHAGIPVLASPLKEVKHIIDAYQVGTCIENHDSMHIAERIKFIFSDMFAYTTWKSNTKAAAQELCWQNEEKVLQTLFFD